MNKYTLTKALITGVTVVTLLGGAAPAFAAATTTTATTTPATLASVIAKGDSQISVIIGRLNTLISKIATMKLESAANKASLTAQLQASITNLTTLKTKIDGETTVASAKADVATIYTNNRVGAVVMPRVQMTASADQLLAQISDLSARGTTTQARIVAAQAAGKNVTALNALYADFQAKIVDATTNAHTVQTSLVGLVPDNGNVTVLASNKVTVTTAHTTLKTAQSDVAAARLDLKNILIGLK